MLYNQKKIQLKMKIGIYLFLILTTINSNGYTQLTSEVKKVHFEETFDSNVNKWFINNSWKRRTTINNGLLIDHNTHYLMGYVNAIQVDIDNTEEHIITFKVANLNNKKATSYRVFKEKKDGSQGRAKYIDNTHYSIIWGFKDYNNYNALEIVTVYDYGLRTKCRAYSVVNGNEILHRDWSHENLLDNETGYNVISIRNTKTHGYFVYLDGYESWEYDSPDLIIKNTEWYGNFVGIEVKHGAKVAFDNLKIEKYVKTDPVQPAINIQMIDLNNLLSEISDNSDSSFVDVNTNRDGKRTIQYVDERFDGILLDDYYVGLELANLVFDIIFGAVNHNQTEVYSAEQLVSGLKNINIDGMSFKTKNRVHYYSWKDVLEFERL